MHDFIWSSDVSGTVISVANPLLDRVAEVLNSEHQVLRSTLIMTVRREQEQLETILDLLQQEYSQPARTGRAQMLGSLMKLLAIWLERNASQRHFSGNQQDRKGEYLNRFNDLINRDFRQHRKVESYARELGITAPYLNNLCQNLVQRSALQLVHDRLLLEAKRELIYTVMSVSEIAYALGFQDPGYFNRFFKRITGQTPKQFRNSSVKSGGQGLGARG